MSENWRKDNAVALENEGARLEIVDKVTGRAKYANDYYLPNMLFAGFIRCPYGSAKVKSSDLSAARRVPGVLEVELTEDSGNYPGYRMGHVCAESSAALRDALAAIKIDWEIDRPRTDPNSLKTPPDKIKPPDNLAAAEAALAQSAAVIEATYATAVQTHCCLEPHVMVVDYRGDRAVVYASTQGTFSVAGDMAAVLGLRPNQVEVHCEHVGGGFGSKFGGGAEGELAARMSKKYNRPCRVSCDRKEEQLDTGNRPGSIQLYTLGAGSDGKIKGGRIVTYGIVGPRAGGGGASAGGGGGGGVPPPRRYNFGAVARSHEDVSLNGGHPRAMRAPGHPQGQFAVELAMDALAEKLNLDPLEFRLLNETSENRKAMLRAGAEIFGWAQKRKSAGTQPGPIKQGCGVAVGDWFNSPGNATITINVYRDGNVEVLSGSQDIGTGFRTLLVDIAHTHLSLPRQIVSAKVGVSNLPNGPASGGSVTSRLVAPRVFTACDMAREAVFKIVAREWGLGDPKSLAIENGVIKSGDKSIEWARACRLMSEEKLTVTTSEAGNYGGTNTGSDAVQFVDVEVDVETGIVRVTNVLALQEVGKPVNRRMIENQICGAVIQGISFALFEDRILNRQLGPMVNANMDMYKIAGPVDVPTITPIIWRGDPRAGVNSLGEPPAIPPPGAVACAVASAIGVQVRSLPITPAKVLAALAGKGGVS